MDLEKLKDVIDDNQSDVEKEEESLEEEVDYIVINKEVITESGKILLKG